MKSADKERLCNICGEPTTIKVRSGYYECEWCWDNIGNIGFRTIYRRGDYRDNALDFTFTQNNWMFHPRVIKRRLSVKKPIYIKMLQQVGTDAHKGKKMKVVGSFRERMGHKATVLLAEPDEDHYPIWLKLELFGTHFHVIDQNQATIDISRYPHKCPHCGSAAYCGLNDIGCSNNCRS